MIDPALMLLARLRLRAWLRRMRRSMSTKHGVAFFVIGALVFTMWLVPAIIGALTSSHATASGHNAQRVRDIMPLLLLGVTLAMATLSRGKIVWFSPAEIDFLFPGPFSRRQLILWKIGMSAFGSLWLALMLSILQLRNASMWIAALLGIWLSLIVAQALSMLILLGRQAIAAKGTSIAVRVVMIAVLLFGSVAVLDILRPLLPLVTGGDFSFAELLAHKRASLPARIVLAPFDVLTLTFAAERLYPDLLRWLASSILLLAVLIWLILRLDEYFIETSLRASERVHAAMQRMKRSGGNPFGGASKPMAGARLPMLPWLGGAGPVAWRQMMLAVRGARGLALVIVLLLLGLAPFMWIMSQKDTAALPLMIVAGFWMVFLLPSMLRFDFRGDLNHIENLKMLPVKPTMIAVGQLIAPSLTLTVLAGCVNGAMIAIAPEQTLKPSVIAMLFLPLLALLTIGIENAAFLMFPTAQVMNTPGDMTMMGRMMVIFFVKAMAILLALCAIGGIGGAALALTGSWTVALVAAWIVLAIIAIATVRLVARLFAKFDVSLGRPA